VVFLVAPGALGMEIPYHHYCLL